MDTTMFDHPRHNTRSLHIAMLFILVSPGFVFSQTPQIFVDGDVSDWQRYAPLYEDRLGDATADSLDFGTLWVTNDDRFLFLNIETGTELSIQSLNDLVLYLDTDNDEATGTPIQGIGAELVWRFGARSGDFTHNAQSVPVQQGQIGLVTAPTVTAAQFEIAFDRTAEPIADIPLFMSDSLRIVFQGGGTGADKLPDEGTLLSYGFNPVPLPRVFAPSLKKLDTAHLRLLSYNVLHDGLFDPARTNSFSRILNALAPDLIGFQEIYDHNAEQVAEQIETMLPSGEQAQWYSAKIEPDIIAVSRFPIVSEHLIKGGNGGFLINLRPTHDSHLLLIVAHPPCCDNHSRRQDEIDAIMEYIREVKAGSFIDVAPDTPIVIVGDMNLVGFAQNLSTFLTGDIINENTYGPDFAPDWDDTELTDLNPPVTERPMFFTWYQESSAFSPGRLDYIIYTDSVVKPGNNFVLFTPALSDDALTLYGLHATDATTASDHLPVVGDFIFPLGSSHVDK
jgi:hypothetical protein